MISVQNEVIMCNCKIDTFAVGKDKGDTKEDTGKSMKNTLYVLGYACQKEPVRPN